MITWYNNYILGLFLLLCKQLAVHSGILCVYIQRGTFGGYLNFIRWNIW